MQLRKTIFHNLLFVLAGAVVAVLWVILAGGSQLLSSVFQPRPVYFLLLFSITGFFIFVRFIRWHFLLRRIGVRVSTRPSLWLYLASLAGTATPAYLGETIRSIFMRRRFGVPFRVTTWVLVIERLFDVIALGVIGFLTASIGWNKGIMALFVLLASLLFLFSGVIAQKVGIQREMVVQLRRPLILLQTLCLSLIAWLPAALLISIAAAGLRLHVSPLEGMSVFSLATLFGGLTLSPAGIGTTGSLAILRLRELNLDITQSVSIVTLVRITSTGAALTTGVVFFLREWMALRHPQHEKPSLHFDQIAVEYRSQFQDHIWNHLLERKSALLSGSLLHLNQGIGLDLGCGLGYQIVEMGKRGYRVIGTDIALNLIRLAHKKGAVVANGDALALPFQDQSLDYVYTIGVLHHLPGSIVQQAVFQEVARVLKPNGRFVIHETNPNNPVFRFYMGYIFPLLRSIDEGIEWWIPPDTWKNIQGLELIEVKYFTFMPDFLPGFMLRAFRKLESRLERSPLRTFSVHYMAVTQRTPLKVDMPVFNSPHQIEEHAELL